MKTHTQRALVVSGLWLHIGFIGAAALAAGLLQLFDGDPAWPLSLGLMLSGGVLAVAGWHRGWMVLEHTGAGPIISTDASSESTSRNQSRPIGRAATGTLTLIALRSSSEHRQ
jgi:hypothetical protein